MRKREEGEGKRGGHNFPSNLHFFHFPRREFDGLKERRRKGEGRGKEARLLLSSYK